MDKSSAIKKMGLAGKQKNELNFTDLERQCVLHFMQNNTLAKIAMDLQLSEFTVEFYLMNAIQKLYLTASQFRDRCESG